MLFPILFISSCRPFTVCGLFATTRPQPTRMRSQGHSSTSSMTNAAPEIMRTDEKQYSDYLENKYLPGRTLYLRYFFYPKLFRAFPGTDTIVDLGCGTGEFLKSCRQRKRDVIGIDSNEALANRCRQNGFRVELDDICELASLK